jgi:hypothetical protein
MITQSVSKEEREKGGKGVILGNAKIVSQLSNQQVKEAESGLPF